MLEDYEERDFRRIPGFRGYEITEKGVVRNARSGKILKSFHPMGLHVQLTNDGGVSKTRAIRRLVKLAFPPAPKVESYDEYEGGYFDEDSDDFEDEYAHEEFRTIPAFPRYEITISGVVRNKSTKDLVALKQGRGWSVQLFDGERMRSRGIPALVVSAYGLFWQR